MKLLLDQNLSHRMLGKLETTFPGSSHVMLLDLHMADDRRIWQYAKDNGFTIVTLDSDFHELTTFYGAPPKIIWLKCGNRPRRYIEKLLLDHRDQVEDFEGDTQVAVLEIY